MKKTNVVLTQEEWAKFKPELVSRNINFNPCGYGKDVYIGMELTDEEIVIVDEILERI